MSLLDALLDQGFRQPASCLIQVGQGLRDLGQLAGLVKSVEIQLSRTEAAAGTIVFEDVRKEDGNWMVADSGLFTRWAQVRVTADFGTYQEEIVRGYVKALKPNHPPQTGEATFEVQFQDDSLLLDREHVRTIWGDTVPQTDLLILQQIVSPVGLMVDPRSGQGQSGRALSQDGPPIRFLRDRAKANGYELTFEEGQVYFGPPRLEGQAVAKILVYAGPTTNCVSFSVVDDALKPDKVAFDLAPADQGAQPKSESLGPDARVLGSSAAADEGSDLPAPFVWKMSREGDETETQIRARAQALANDNSFKLRATGELDGSLYGHVLKPGRLAPVDGVGQRYGGLYYVDKVTHAFSPDGYRQRFEMMRNATGDDGGGPGLTSALSAIASLFH